MKIEWMAHQLQRALKRLRNAAAAVTGCFKEKIRKAAQYCRLISMRLNRRVRGIHVAMPVRAAIIIATCICASLIVTPSSSLIQAPGLGEPASETIVSPVTFKVMDEEATYKNREEILKSVKPVYDFDDEAAYEVLGRIAAAFNFMRTHTAESSIQRGQGKTARLNGYDFRTVLADTSNLSVENDGLRTRFESMLGAKISGYNFSVLKSKEFNPQIETDLKSLLMTVILRGILTSRDSIGVDGKNGIVLLRKSSNKFQYVRDPSTLFELREAIGFINSWKSEPVLNSSLNHAIRLLAMDLVDANIRSNPQMSLSLRQTALWSVKPLYFDVTKGQTIIRKGEPADKGHIARISALSSTMPVHGRYALPGGTAGLFCLLFLLCSYSCRKFCGDAAGPTGDVISSCLLFLGTITAVHLTTLSPDLNIMGRVVSSACLSYAVPVAVGPMLITLLHDARRGFMFAALISAAAALSLGGDLRQAVFYLFSGIAGAHCMSVISSRTGIMWSGLVIGSLNPVFLFLIKLTAGELPQNHMSDMFMGFCGGALSGPLVYSATRFLEITGHITRFRLSESADPDHPPIKQTAMHNRELYDHSVKVSNLAQIMAEAINADVMKARVGGLYHDIGKFRYQVEPTKYFGTGERVFQRQTVKIDDIPDIEKSHAALGAETARKLKLCKSVSDIIVQHHGTVPVNFADTGHKQRNEDSAGNELRYAGPLPQTKEAGLVMTAEIIVTAFGSVARATPGAIRKRTAKLVMGLFNDGQFNESGLTLRDLDVIIKVVTGKLQENSRLA